MAEAGRFRFCLLVLFRFVRLLLLLFSQSTVVVCSTSLSFLNCLQRVFPFCFISGTFVMWTMTTTTSLGVPSIAIIDQSTLFSRPTDAVLSGTVTCSALKVTRDDGDPSGTYSVDGNSGAYCAKASPPTPCGRGWLLPVCVRFLCFSFRLYISSSSSLFLRKFRSVVSGTSTVSCDQG